MDSIESDKEIESASTNTETTEEVQEVEAGEYEESPKLEND